MIRSTSNCGSSLFFTENVVSNYMSFIGLTQYDWENPTMMDGPDDPDPKTAKQARGTIQYGPDEEDPRQAEEPYRRFIGIVLYGDNTFGYKIHVNMLLTSHGNPVPKSRSKSY
ncbi:hypothetical protein NEUTE1DRAFT_42619 [Neurospora tetrasperma FGSC 2508]|uniref:Uncharacterized protein n=1 Tax=Neurospora tetrasperma (strain FGSC 2508 / ATCC MYA-4615 / P0657) TaxID=510951 RepID=F8MMX3_NEUT8|nr:uncharacterized protein NEUTE1DRAFT_42619 [Neurospora tetrasperma FGSC 2508]EGO57997.1 hypothetical protein NEUTE1DRAFT_42619 [Neurospora tetrasperma FGSC 2508]